MHRRDLLRAIARRTGDNLTTIKRLGFHLETESVPKDSPEYKHQSPSLSNHDAKPKAHCCLEDADA